MHEVKKMTIYCDCKTCLYNEDGFCNAEKINISGFECTTATGFDDPEGDAE